MHFSDFKFDCSYAVAKAELSRLTRLYTLGDKLERFVLGHSIEEAKCALDAAEVVLSENLDRLFRLCEKLKIPRIYIGNGELVGADDVHCGSYPAVWQLSVLLDPGLEEPRPLKFRVGCGNTDQTQTTNTELFLPKFAIDAAFDVSGRRIISDEPFVEHMVVTRHERKKRNKER